MGENRVSELVASLVILYTISFLFAALRIYVRVFISKNWGLDDYLLMATLGVFTADMIVAALGIHYGAGRHVQDIPQGDVPPALMYFWLGELAYTVTTVFLRLSIAVFLLRICVKRAHKYLIYGTMLMVVIYSIFYLLLAIFQCQPTSYFWNQYAGAQGTCLDKSVFPDATFAHSAVSATADFILGILPIGIIWDLKMNFRTKASVGLILSLGVVAGLGTLIRIPYIRVLAITDDFLFATVDVAIWSTVEPALGIVAASSCVLRPLFKKFYDLSSRGTYASRGATLPSARMRSRTGGISIAMEEGLEFNKNAARMNGAESIITSGGHITSMSNHISAAGREKKGVTFHTKSLTSSSSSQEELAPKRGGGIQVQRTVDIVRTHRRGEDDDNGSTSSTKSQPPTTWPKS